MLPHRCLGVGASALASGSRCIVKGHSDLTLVLRDLSLHHCPTELAWTADSRCSRPCLWCTAHTTLFLSITHSPAGRELLYSPEFPWGFFPFAFTFAALFTLLNQEARTQ